MKTTILITLAALASENRQRILRSVLVVIFALMPPMLTAQTTAVDPCGAVLIQEIDYATLDDQSANAYLSVIDKNTWDSKKTDAGFVGKWTGFLGPMSGDFSYEKFDQARTSYFKRIKYNASAATSIMKLRKFITAPQLEAWVKCIERQGRSGLFLTEKSVNDDTATFELVWVSPATGATEVPITSSQITGGRALDAHVPAGQIFPDGEPPLRHSKVFTVSREPSRPLTITINAGEQGVTDTIDSSRTLALENSVRVLQNKLDEATTSIKALTAEYESLRKALEEPPIANDIRDPGATDGNADTTHCPANTYMVGIRYQIDKGGPHGITSHLYPIYRRFTNPSVAKHP